MRCSTSSISTIPLASPASTRVYPWARRASITRAPSPIASACSDAPILEEWADRGDVTLEALVAHVTIHEIGHHFGFSDEAMHALEEEIS